MAPQHSGSSLADAIGAIPEPRASWSNWACVGLCFALAACAKEPANAVPLHGTGSAVKPDGVGRIITFDEIGGWPYVEGLKGMPESVRRWSGQRVEMIGYLLPIDGLEALLVESLMDFGPCQGSDINRIVHVTMPGKATAESLRRRVKVSGVFSVGATIQDGYCVDIYQVRADGLEVIE